MNEEKIILDIIDLTEQGQGIGKLEGFTYFVEDALPGDRVEALVTKKKKNYGFARCEKLLAPSPDRQGSPCPHWQRCGGCPLLGLKQEAQLKLKKRWVTEKLKRLGGVEEPPVEDVISMEVPFGYRNKSGFSVFAEKGRAAVGYCERGSHRVLDCPNCVIMSEAAELIAAVMRKYIPAHSGILTDAKTGKCIIRQLTVRTAFGTGEVMVILGVEDKVTLPETAELIEALESALAGSGYALCSLVLQQGGGAGKLPKYSTLAGRESILDEACGLSWEISPASFYQVNSVQMEALYGKVKEFADLTGAETVLDLYCGVGTIGLVLSEQAGSVLGVESVKPAVVDANRNAVINGNIKTTFRCGKAEELLPEILAGGADRDGFPIPPVKPDVVILDPPRAGCDPALLDAVLGAAPEKIVYVSCDPATLARDIKLLGEGGYRLQTVQPVDMFPGTLHIESAALLRKTDRNK